ncbi:unnamed protein product [Caenorhabditis sp. 36 PRJEB53466]|nr:unnamed protein product [Caenorhabditis sp. 36 PRJEB53466]
MDPQSKSPYKKVSSDKKRREKVNTKWEELQEVVQGPNGKKLSQNDLLIATINLISDENDPNATEAASTFLDVSKLEKKVENTKELRRLREKNRRDRHHGAFEALRAIVIKKGYIGRGYKRENLDRMSILTIAINYIKEMKKPATPTPSPPPPPPPAPTAAPPVLAVPPVDPNLFFQQLALICQAYQVLLNGQQPQQEEQQSQKSPKVVQKSKKEEKSEPEEEDIHVDVVGFN